MPSTPPQFISKEVPWPARGGEIDLAGEFPANFRVQSVVLVGPSGPVRNGNQVLRINAPDATFATLVSPFGSVSFENGAKVLDGNAVKIQELSVVWVTGTALTLQAYAAVIVAPT